MEAMTTEVGRKNDMIQDQWKEKVWMENASSEEGLYVARGLRRLVEPTVDARTLQATRRSGSEFELQIIIPPSRNLREG